MKKTIYLRLTPELKEKIEKQALEMGLSINALVIMILTAEVNKKRKKEQ